MKKILAVAICIFFLTMPNFSYGATNTEVQYRNLLLEIIVLLQKQIVLLKNEIENQREGTASVKEKPKEVPRQVPKKAPEKTVKQQLSSIPIGDLISSKFYDGPYRALFSTNGYTLHSIGSSQLNSTYSDIWDMFVDMAGEHTVKELVSEFRIYDDRNADFDAFADKIGVDDSWVLGVNVYDTDLDKKEEREVFRDLLLHEYGHMLMDAYGYVRDAFKEQFWNEADLDYARKVGGTPNGAKRDSIVSRYYESHKDRFVSEYAATSPLEDSIESFVFFATAEAPKSTATRAKIQFFSAYPEFVEVRSSVLEGM